MRTEIQFRVGSMAVLADTGMIRKISISLNKSSLNPELCMQRADKVQTE